VPTKCYTIPGVVLLLLIILPLTVSKYQPEGKSAEGWISVGFCAAGILIYIILKWLLAGPLDRYLENHKS